MVAADTIGAFFTNLRAGDIELPWASILRFLDVAAVIGVVLWLAWRHQRRMDAGSWGRPTAWSAEDTGGRTE